jgi:hypothetical protein
MKGGYETRCQRWCIDVNTVKFGRTWKLPELLLRGYFKMA